MVEIQFVLVWLYQVTEFKITSGKNFDRNQHKILTLTLIITLTVIESKSCFESCYFFKKRIFIVYCFVVFILMREIGFPTLQL